MKKIFLIVISIATLIFIGCSLDDSSRNNSITFNNNVKSSKVLSNNNNPYDYIGVKHNEGMDFILQKLIQLENNNTIISIDSLNIFISKQINSFCLENVYSFNLFDQKDFFKTEQINLVFNNLLIGIDIIDTLATLNELNLIQKNYISSISSIFRNSDTISSIECSLISMNIDLSNNDLLTEDEKIIIYGATSVGIYSLKYWETYIELWYSTLGSLLSNNDFDIEVSYDEILGIGGDDVSGMIGGAVAGGIIGGLPGIIPGGIGGGVAASITGIAIEFMKEYFPNF